MRPGKDKTSKAPGTPKDGTTTDHNGRIHSPSRIPRNLVHCMCFCRSSPSPVLSLAPQFLLSEIRISDLTRTAKGTLTSVTLQWLSHFPKVQLHATFTCSPLKGLQWPGKQMMLNTDMCLVWSNDKDGKVDMKRGCIFGNHKTLKTMKPQTSLRTFENI